VSDAPRLKPLFLIKPKTISAKDIRRAEKQAGICIVECTEPEQARFLEPPINAEIDVQARAALTLMRYILDNTNNSSVTFNGSMLVKWFTNALLHESRPAAVPKVKK
jgi:hypothetical protein